MSPSIINKVSNYIGWDKDYLIHLSKQAPKSYRRFKIPKKGGGTRSIFHPSAKTKALQYAIIETILSNTILKPHDNALAYVAGKKSPLLMNAKLHKDFKYSIRIDLKNFFPSIKPTDLISVIQYKLFKSMPINVEDEEFLVNSLFIDHPSFGKSLAIGAPSSPIISNIVMYDIDDTLSNYANTKRSSYSRYADDFVFSTNIKGGCAEFYNNLKTLFENTASPTLKINNDKTVFMSRGTRRSITGLTITPDGNISIGRRQKKYIKKLIYESIGTTKILSDEENNYIRGYLSFIRDVEPAYIDRLIIKYGSKEVLKFF